MLFNKDVIIITIIIIIVSISSSFPNSPSSLPFSCTYSASFRSSTSRNGEAILENEPNIIVPPKNIPGMVSQS